MSKKSRKEAKRAKRELKALRRAADERDPDASRLPFVGRTLAGVIVTPDNSLQLATVWACIRYLSQTVAMLPWNVMASPAGKGAEVQSKHPVQWLLHNRPNPEWSSFQFRETLVHWALRRGNGYAEIERDMAGRPFALWPVHPERTDVMRDAETDKLFYRVDNGSGTTGTTGKVDIPAEDMFHLRGFGEGVVGVNVVEYAAESLGWAKAMQLFGASFFGNGANISGVIQKKGKFGEGAVPRIRAEFNKLYRGPRRANSTAFLDDEMEFKPTGVEPQKAQMVDANYFLIEEICRWFGVPPHKVAHLLRATFSNIEHQSIEVVQDSLLPWVKRLEDEADYKLFGQNRQGLFTKIELKGLLRGDFKSQQEGLEIQRRNGIINADEWREITDQAPMPGGAGGDLYVMQGQNVPLSMIGEVASTQAAQQQQDPGGGDAEDAAKAELDAMAEEEADAA